MAKRPGKKIDAELTWDAVAKKYLEMFEEAGRSSARGVKSIHPESSRINHRGHRDHGGGMNCPESPRIVLFDPLISEPTPVNFFHPVLQFKNPYSGSLWMFIGSELSGLEFRGGDISCLQYFSCSVKLRLKFMDVPRFLKNLRAIFFF